MKPGVLIANRGEIACRIIRSCHEMGPRAIAVHSDAGREACMSAWPMKPLSSAPRQCAKVISTSARRSGVRYLHPGYGLLSENAEFARQVQAAGLRWLGPSPESIVAMGQKARARAIAKAAGVPVPKGSGLIQPSYGTDFDAR